VFKSLFITACFLGATALPQQETKPPQEPSGQPQIKLNYLNVCTPSTEDQTLIKSALGLVPSKPAFVQDFEISRGLATLKDAPPSKFVRLRREFSAESPFLTVQYSMSSDSDSTIETLVLRTRDPKVFHELSFEDRSTSGAASPQTLLTVDTPVSRIRMERLSKSSVVLARCEGADQTAYEPLFRQASDIMAQYRQALGLRGAFRSDIAWLTGASPARHNGPPSEQKKKQK
jgi:hypothetical protein